MEKIPADLKRALTANKIANTVWQDITPIARRGFIGWLDQAKQEETRKRRIEVTCSKLASGKRRPCCYAIVPMGIYKALGTNPKAKATWSTLTPDERRDFVEYIDEKQKSETKVKRIEKVCSLLASGKRHP